eukprot:CAMPEP_0197836912 /NCGR_PEP_ID=MMETSP1437-20131217/30432_1 /TAXON_ID=49252 ORGANISM="Eucampia antarctica, Strain CCMP1452" /NCGR_SAMPLE_ID=MMETSP1437 /ASSEMBLY_ACC=CAM_ASM_001096 /LENGTH=516 /DNA_ID=CAMNT_0043443473 /DNA_START=174 /DNA_END=1724 /DNA_ORIENTATION=-
MDRCRLLNNKFPRVFSTATAAHDQSLNAFPSIVIGANTLSPQGSFAEAQAHFLKPDENAVEELAVNLLKSNMGVVAHYYMDVELQAVLTAVHKGQQLSGGKSRIAIADSLAMGDFAVKMCEEGATSIACLGVDFMSESVATIMTRNGFGHIPVYRATSKSIGCSLAESAERDSYRAWLHKGKAANPSSLHIVYINTSLETKAVSSSIMPTITCTSSNVMLTMLQASAQIPDISILYGPDTYMGENLVNMFDAILKAGWTDDQIKRDLHPLHNKDSIRRLRDCIDVFPNGNCVVHHMFGGEVVRTVKENYDDAFVSAHLEVPGEMFEIAMEKSLEGKGVVGSTSDILKFISEKVTEAAKEDTTQKKRLKFILGTEAGMVTSIVKSAQEILQLANSSNVEAEIIFPVSSEAVMGTEDSELAVVPGVAGGEGCSTAGGCATCPFMKMNDLDALNDVIDLVIKNEHEFKLKSFLPPDKLRGKKIDGTCAIDLGSEPIIFMRNFMKEKSIPLPLVQKITGS